VVRQNTSLGHHVGERGKKIRKKKKKGGRCKEKIQDSSSVRKDRGGKKLVSMAKKVDKKGNK